MKVEEAIAKKFRGRTKSNVWIEDEEGESVFLPVETEIIIVAQPPSVKAAADRIAAAMAKER